MSATSDLAVAVGEGVVQLGSDTLHGIGGALSGIQDGVNAYILDDKSIKESVEIMNKSSADYKDRHGYKLSEKSQEAVNQNPVVKAVNSTLENTVGKGINYAQEQMNAKFVFYAGSILGVVLDLSPATGKINAVVKQTGARVVLADSLDGWNKSIKHYELIRNDLEDIAIIAKNTGFKEFHVARIKEHVFFKKHLLSDGRFDRFDPDPEIVNAWSRLRKNDFIESDLKLLNHEIFETKFEGIFKVPALDAHDAALRSGRKWELGE